MRPVNLALLVLLGLLGIVSAAAAADGDVLKKFGMLGTTAVDCAAPPSPSNPYVIFAVSPKGKATRTLKMMDPGSTPRSRYATCACSPPTRCNSTRPGGSPS